MSLSACLHGERDTLVSGLAPFEGKRYLEFTKKNFTGRVALQPETTSRAVILKGSGNN